MVDWEDFIFQLKTTGLKIDETATRQLKYILGNNPPVSFRINFTQTIRTRAFVACSNLLISLLALGH